MTCLNELSSLRSAQRLWWLMRVAALLLGLRVLRPNREDQPRAVGLWLIFTAEVTAAAAAPLLKLAEALPMTVDVPSSIVAAVVTTNSVPWAENIVAARRKL